MFELTEFDLVQFVFADGCQLIWLENTNNDYHEKSSTFQAIWMS